MKIELESKIRNQNFKWTKYTENTKMKIPISIEEIKIKLKILYIKWYKNKYIYKNMYETNISKINKRRKG